MKRACVSIPWLGPAVFLAGSLCCQTAYAQSAASADALFRDAKARVERGDFGSACALFQESERLDPAAGTLLNWADCEERRGHVAQAWQLFVQAKEALPEGDERNGYAEERIAGVASRVPHVTLVPAAGAHRPLHVRVDDAEYSEAALGVALPVDPGRHTIRVDSPGYAVAETVLAIAEAESKTLPIDAGLRLAVLPPLATEAPAPSHRVLGSALAGVGIAGIATGIVSGVFVLVDADTYKAHCTPGCDSEGASAARAGQPLGILSPIAFGIGLLSGGVGTYVLLSSKKSPHVRMSWAGISGEFWKALFCRGIRVLRHPEAGRCPSTHAVPRDRALGIRDRCGPRLHGVRPGQHRVPPRRRRHRWSLQHPGWLAPVAGRRRR